MRALSLYFLYLITILSISCDNQENNKLTVAVSSNAQFAIGAVADIYEKKENIEIELISSSSGKLTSQIIQGAPFDIFISADTLYPNYIYKNLSQCDEPKIYAKGSIVLWSTTLDESVTIDKLKSDAIKKVAIANPETAPYGKACIEILKKLKLYEKLKSKLVYAESISQCTQFVENGAAEMGFTSASILLSDRMKKYTNWIAIDTTLYSPIIQAMIVIRPNQQSRQFEEFVLSDSGQRILSEYGYFRPE